MNRADYRMLGWFCTIFGCFLIITSIAVNIMVGNKLTQLDASVIPPFGGIILFVVGTGFFWRARQEK